MGNEIAGILGIEELADPARTLLLELVKHRLLRAGNLNVKL